MSRSGYSDECEHPHLYRGSVDRAMGGKRGQRALRDIVSALDAMPVKELLAGSFSRGGGSCTLGALADARGVDVSDLERDTETDPYYQEEVDSWTVGKRLDIAPAMAAEVMFVNDEAPRRTAFGRSDDFETPAGRWERMRKWAVRNTKATPEATPQEGE